MSGNITPGFQWDILNYGRFFNNVRLQDAKFQELIAVYQQTVLTASMQAYTLTQGLSMFKYL